MQVPSHKHMNEPKIIPTTKTDYADESLSKSDNHSFTQVASSSSQNCHNKKHKHARQSILDTIMLHINLYKPPNVSKGPSFEDIESRFSSSIAPTVYRSFERIVV